MLSDTDVQLLSCMPLPHWLKFALGPTKCFYYVCACACVSVRVCALAVNVRSKTKEQLISPEQRRRAVDGTWLEINIQKVVALLLFEREVGGKSEECELNIYKSTSKMVRSNR